MKFDFKLYLKGKEKEEILSSCFSIPRLGINKDCVFYYKHQIDNDNDILLIIAQYIMQYYNITIYPDEIILLK